MSEPPQGVAGITETAPAGDEPDAISEEQAMLQRLELAAQMIRLRDWSGAEAVAAKPDSATPLADDDTDHREAA